MGTLCCMYIITLLNNSALMLMRVFEERVLGLNMYDSGSIVMMCLVQVQTFPRLPVAQVCAARGFLSKIVSRF